MNKTLTTMLKRWGEYSNHHTRISSPYDENGEWTGIVSGEAKTFENFMSWWYSKEKDNLEEGE